MCEREQFSLRIHENSQDSGKIADGIGSSKIGVRIDGGLGIRCCLFDPTGSSQHCIAVSRRVSRTLKLSKWPPCVMKLCQVQKYIVDCICVSREAIPGSTAEIHTTTARFH